MRIALVINARSGSMSGGMTPQAIRDKITGAGLEVIREQDEDAPLPERLEAAAGEPGIDALAVAGGDGTVACAASVMVGRTVPLGLLPLGTMNMLAKDLGLPLALDEAVATIRSGAPKSIDVGEVNGHIFLISSMLGLPARMAKYREAQRGSADPWRGAGRFATGLARHLWSYPREPIACTVDDVERLLRVHILAVVNNDFVERPGHIMVRDPVDGGQLTLYIAERLTIWRMARLASGMVFGDWHHLPGLQRQPASRLTIASRQKALRVMNDGEVRLIEAPLHYRIRSRSLAVIVPRTAENTRVAEDER